MNEFKESYERFLRQITLGSFFYVCDSWLLCRSCMKQMEGGFMAFPIVPIEPVSSQNARAVFLSESSPAGMCGDQLIKTCTHLGGVQNRSSSLRLPPSSLFSGNRPLSALSWTTSKLFTLRLIFNFLPHRSWPLGRTCWVGLRPIGLNSPCSASFIVLPWLVFIRSSIHLWQKNVPDPALADHLSVHPPPHLQ